MKKIILYLVFFCILFNFTIIQYPVFADAKISKVAICLEHLENLDEDLQNKFEDLKCPLSIKVFDVNSYARKLDRYYYYKFDLTKNVLVSTNNPSNMREVLYNALTVAKNDNYAIVIYDLSKLEPENVYFAISDSVVMLSKLGVQFVLINELY